MESSLIRILPACLTSPLPAGWDQATPGYTIEVMPEVDQPEAVPWALPTTEPDMLLLDADYPGMEPFALIQEALAARPGLAVIILSQDSSPERLRRAMLAGVEEYLIRPLEATAVRDSIIAVASHRTLRVVQGEFEAPVAPVTEGIVVGVVSAKGRLGKTTLAVNMAALVASTPGKSASLVGLESGDGAVLLSLQPRLGLLDMVGEVQDESSFSPDFLKQFATPHRSGLTYWTWQGSATRATEDMPEDFLYHLFATFRRTSTVTLVDFDLLSADEAASVLPLMDIILVLTSSSDLLAMRSTKGFLDALGPDVKPRVRIVINRADAADMLTREDVEQALAFKVAAVIPNQLKTAAEAINMGVPFVLSKQHESELGVSLRTFAQTLFKLPPVEEGRRRRFRLF